MTLIRVCLFVLHLVVQCMYVCDDIRFDGGFKLTFCTLKNFDQCLSRCTNLLLFDGCGRAVQLTYQNVRVVISAHLSK